MRTTCPPSPNRRVISSANTSPTAALGFESIGGLADFRQTISPAAAVATIARTNTILWRSQGLSKSLQSFATREDCCFELDKRKHDFYEIG